MAEIESNEKKIKRARPNKLCTSILKSTQCVSVCLSVIIFNPLPMKQFDGQVYLWISFNKAEILRPF